MIKAWYLIAKVGGSWFLMNEKEIKLMLNIPENRTIGLLITLGYAPENYLQRRKIRKPIEKTVKWNGY